MKKLLLFVVCALLVIAVFPASARPQLATPSIGWIEPSDIECPITSDHTCFVKKDAYTWTDQTGSIHKYRVKAGTDLDILNEGKHNEGSYPKDYDSNPNAGGYVHHRRVEVGIIIPADWDSNGNLKAFKPCHVKAEGQFPPIVSLACKTATRNSPLHEIHIQKGKECWSYVGHDSSFVGQFLSWQDVTVKAFFETDEGIKDAQVKVYNLTNDRQEIPATQAGSYPTPEGGNATFEIDVQIDRPYKDIHFHICAISEKM
jgi:hypothetical protein